MGRKQKKYHYIYKTTNVLNDKFYIGMHSTDNLNDGYIGSGKRLWYSINYHGKDNHVCEILEYCKDREELRLREEEIINSDLLNEDLCLNLVKGGTGFMLDDRHFKCSKSGGEAHRKKIKNDLEYAKIHSERMSKMTIERHKNNDCPTIANYDWNGKKHSEETKLKMRKPKNVGEKNSQFGSCWITNEIVNKKIKRGDLIPSGFRLGRKMI